MAKKEAYTRKFHLKPFSLSHHRSSMKAGTDSLLLGTWTDPSDTASILDIGTGCGILALFMASKSKAQIDAVELDPQSVAEAKCNFHESPFHKRLRVIESDFNDYVKTSHNPYDLIISNPPFFINDLRPSDKQKKDARHADALTYHQLISGSKVLLNKDGRLCLVLPYEESSLFLKLAAAEGFFIRRQMVIFSVRGMQPNRINLELGHEKPARVEHEMFTIREEDGTFSRQFMDFLKDFYIGDFR
jgi:tRNA1Val (adenine37-N6)-methyltransferase